MNLDRIGKYRIVDRIGQGAMGEVFKAHDPFLNRYVALKTIAPALAGDADFRQRFQREAQSAAQLNHPNIVTIYEFGSDEAGLTYMAMELLEGVDLREAIRRRSLGTRAASSTATSSPGTSTSSRPGRRRSSTSASPASPRRT
jgi:serine/threonine protein kinase